MSHKNCWRFDQFQRKDQCANPNIGPALRSRHLIAKLRSTQPLPNAEHFGSTENGTVQFHNLKQPDWPWAVRAVLPPLSSFKIAVVADNPTQKAVVSVKEQERSITRGLCAISLNRPNRGSRLSFLEPRSDQQPMFTTFLEQIEKSCPLHF